jgi:hypothetical protein
MTNFTDRINPAPPALVYQAPDSGRPGRIVRSALLFFLACLIASAIFNVLLLLWVPHCRMVFRDFRTTLPAFTIAILELSQFMTEYFGWVLLILPVFILPVPMGVFAGYSGSKSRRRSVTALLLGVLAAFTLIGCAAIVVSMELSMIKLSEAVR